MFFFSFFNLLLIPFLGQESIRNNSPSFLNNSSLLKSLSANKNGVDLHHEEGLVNNCQVVLFLNFNQDSTLNILLYSLNFSNSRAGGIICLFVKRVLSIEEPLLVVEHDNKNNLLEQCD